MADAQFTFETNIRQISREVSQGLAEISNATRASSGASAGDFTAGLAAGIERDVKKSLSFLENLSREFQRLAEQGKAHPSGQTYADLGQAELERLRSSTQSKIQTRAVQFQAKGGDIGTLDLSAYYRQIDKSLIARVANTARALTRDIEKTGTPQQQAVFGSSQTFAPLARSRDTPNLGTVDSLNAAKAAERTRIADEKAADSQRKANEAAADKERKANEKAADKQRKDAEQAATRKQKLDEAAAEKERKANEAAAEKERKANEKAAQAARDVQEEAARKAAAAAEAQRRLQQTTEANQARPGVNPRGTLAAADSEEQQLAIFLEQRARDPRRDAKEGLPPSDVRIVTDSVRARDSDGVTRYYQQNFAEGTAGEIDPKDPSLVAKFLKVAREDAYNQAVANATLETDRVAQASGRLYDSLVREAAAYEKRGTFQAVAPDQPDTRFVDKGSLIRQTEAGSEYFGGTGKNQVRLLNPEDDADAARIAQLKTADLTNRKAAQGDAEIEAAKENRRRDEEAGRATVQGQREVHDALVRLALAYNKRATAEAIGPETPQVRYAGPNSFVRTTDQGTDYFGSEGNGRSRLLNPEIAADRAGIAEIKAVDAANRNAAQRDAETAAGVENAERERQASIKIAEVERALADVYSGLVEDVKRNATAGIRATPDPRLVTDARVRQIDASTIADDRSGQLQIFGRNAQSGGLKEIKREEQPVLFDAKADADAANQLRSREIAYAKVLAEAEAAQRDQNRALKEQSQYVRELSRGLSEAGRKGVLNNFVGGVFSGGFGSHGGGGGEGGGGGGAFGAGGAFNFEGLARSAGQTLKYQGLYAVFGDLQRLLGEVSKEFLDMDDSLTELDVAMGGTTDITATFLNQLQDFASVGGFNVGEAMDVAASGIRAFRDEVQATGGDLDQMGAAYAQQAGQLAVLSKTTLTDSAGNLKAVAAGFNLPKSGTGFSEVKDAIAGAKLTGGGDEKQIYQGLANSALIFKELGFSLNESATIISKINAETDQSGQIIATRVSRLGQIIGGSSGKNFLSQLNTQLQPEQRIDLTASIRDQVLQLSSVYGTLSQAQRQTVNSALGGTANARELIILLQQMGTIVKETDKGFVGKGQEEFEKRLQNVRAQLTQIQGNLKAIITNLAETGLATPFVVVVETVKFLSTALREATQFAVQLLAPFQTLIRIATPLILLAGAIKGIASIRSVGGIGNFVQGAEEHILPAQALARQRLNDAREDQQRTTAVVRQVPSVQGLAAAEQARFVAAANLSQAQRGAEDPTAGLAARARVAASELEVAAADLGAATERLGLAEAQLAAAQSLVAQKTKGLIGPNPNRRFADLRQAQEAEGQAAGAVDTSRAERNAALTKSAVGEAGLKRIEAQQAEELKVTSKFQRLREDAGTALTGSLTRLNQSIDIAAARMDTSRAEGLEARREEIMNAHNARLVELDAQEDLARKGAVEAVQAFSLGVRLANAEGLAGKTEVLRQGLNELSTRSGSITEGSTFTRAASGLAKGARGAFDLIGGGFGVALIGGAIAQEIHSSMNAINAAQGEALIAMNAPLQATTEGLQAASTANATAAKNLQDASSGFFGKIADVLGGSRSGQTIQQAKDLSTLQASQKDAVGRTLAAGQTAPIGNIAQLASGFDATDASSIGKSIQNMTASGQRATDVMAALSLAIHRLGEVGSGTASALSSADRQQIGITVGDESLVALQNRAKAAQEAFATLDPNAHGAAARKRDATLLSPEARQYLNDTGDNFHGNHDASAALAQSDVAGFKALDQNTVRSTIESSTQSFLARPDLNLNDPHLLYSYKQLIDASLNTAVLDPHVRATIAGDAAQKFRKHLDQTIKDLTDPKKLQDYVSNIGATVDLVGQETGSQTALAQLRGGQRDTSSTAAIAAKRVVAQKALSDAEFSAAALTRAGHGEAAALILQVAEDKVNQVELEALQDLRARAKTNADTLNRQESHDLALATGAQQATAILGKYSQASFTNAIGSKDPDNIATWISENNKATVEKKKKVVDDTVAQRRSELAGLTKLKQLNPGENIDLGGAKRNLDAALAQQSAFDTAYGETVPGGLSDLQLAAQKESTTATGKRDTIGGLKAARDGAYANFLLAKTEGEQSKAWEAYLKSEQAVSDAVTATRDAVADISAFPDTAVVTAAKEIRAAAEALDKYKYAKGGPEYAAGLAAMAKGERDLALAKIDEAEQIAQASGDLSDSLAQDANKLTDLKGKLATDTALLKRHPNDKNAQAAVRGDTIALHQQDITNETDRHSEVESNADALLAAGRISHAAYIGVLTAERNQLQEKLKHTKQGANQYVQFQKEILETEGKIKSASAAAAGQFNLGDIKVPTVYEVRRSLQNAAAATSSINSAIIANTTNNTITFNGADLAKMEAVVRQMVGQSNRYTVAGRKA